MTTPLAPRGSTKDAFARRAARAEELAGNTRSGAEALRFAAGLYRAQGVAAGAVREAHSRQPLQGRLSSDLQSFAPDLDALLAYAAESGPDALAAEARARRHQEKAGAHDRLFAFWAMEQGSRVDYLSRALLRPYAEELARLGIAPDRLHAQGRCPFCAGLPWVAARRPLPEADGARRTLGCALCGEEWTFNRLRCPHCAEEDPKRLPSFQSESHPGVRIEACEACHKYVKSIDLTLDGRAIPEVDDLLSLDMDLWAVEQGFERIEVGLAGI